jgi:2'-5' RNA ligase
VIFHRFSQINNQYTHNEYETRDFMPHITLARIKRRFSPTEKIMMIQNFASLSSEVFVIDKFILYASELTPSGAIHSPLKDFIGVIPLA